MPLAQIPLEYFHRLVEQARAEGCNVDALLAELNIAPAEWQNRQVISAFVYGQLYQRVMRETGNEFFGLFSDGKVPLGAFRLMCLSLLSCRDFSQALVRYGEFAEICRGMNSRFLIGSEAGRAVLTLGPIRSVDRQQFARMQAAADPANLVCTMFTSYRFHCWLVGREIPLQSVKLTSGAAQAQFNVDHFCADSVLFDQPYNQLIYPQAALRLPVVQSEDSTMEFLRTAPYHLIVPTQIEVSLADQVRAILNRDVGRNMPSAEAVARQLNVSVPTMRRKLTQQQVTYQVLKDQVRLEAALHYLNCPDLSNNEIGEKLGFDEPSAFFRAFKKWTGRTPGAYRRDLSPESGALRK